MKIFIYISFLFACLVVSANNYFRFPDMFSQAHVSTASEVDEDLRQSIKTYDQVRLAYQSGDMNELMSIYKQSRSMMLADAGSIDHVSAVIFPAYILHLNGLSDAQMKSDLLRSGMVLMLHQQNLNLEEIPTSLLRRANSLVLVWFDYHFRNSGALNRMIVREGTVSMSSYFFDQQMFLKFIDRIGTTFSLNDWMVVYNVLHQEAISGVSDPDFFLLLSIRIRSMMLEQQDIFHAYRELLRNQALALINMNASVLGRAVPLELIERIMEDEDFFAHFVVFSQRSILPNEAFQEYSDQLIAFFRMLGFHINSLH